MAEPLLIEAWFGSERAYGRSASMNIMRVPAAGSEQRETFLAGNKDGRVKVAATKDYEAFPGKIEDFGKWRHGQFRVQDGVVMRVKATRSTGEFGARTVTASLYLQTRAGAALRNVRFKATAATGCAREEYVVRGRFDILTKDQLEEFAGVLPHWLLPEISERSVSAAFTIDVLDAELVARPTMTFATIVDSAGHQQKIAVPARIRRVRV